MTDNEAKLIEIYAANPQEREILRNNKSKQINRCFDAIEYAERNISKHLSADIQQIQNTISKLKYS